MNAHRFVILATILNYVMRGVCTPIGHSYDTHSRSYELLNAKPRNQRVVCPPPRWDNPALFAPDADSIVHTPSGASLHFAADDSNRNTTSPPDKFAGQLRAMLTEMAAAFSGAHTHATPGAPHGAA
eukprot:m.230663 g.230663  ORF g.230663 m.230663 type:complete len:126 (-) comp12094_c0_seq1:341-718(-)